MANLNFNLLGGLSMFDLCVWQMNFVIESYKKGIRSSSLGDQPSPWMLRGLQILESGKELTAERIRQINLSGGTDHPDPTISI